MVFGSKWWWTELNAGGDGGGGGGNVDVFQDRVPAKERSEMKTLRIWLYIIMDISLIFLLLEYKSLLRDHNL